MRLKSFNAENMTEAMAKVKEALGKDAVIVSSRDLESGGVRVTAVLDNQPEPANNLAAYDEEVEFALSQEPKGKSDGKSIDEIEVINDFNDISRRIAAIKDYDNLTQAEIEQEIVSQMTNAFLRHNVPSALADKVLSLLESSEKLTDPKAALIETFDTLFDYDPIPVSVYERPMMVVGAPGAGKTVTVAKLAARAVMNDLKPCVISFDTVRAGGIEQLAAFTTVLKLPLVKVNSPEQLKQAIKDHASADQIIIDSPGTNPFSQEEMKELHEYVKIGVMDLILAMPAAADVQESSEIARAFKIIGARWVIPTRIDIARRVGGILTAAHDADLKFAGIANAPNVADGLQDITAEDLASLILPDSK